MAVKDLTDEFVRNLLKSEKRQQFSDLKSQNLVMIVQPSGKKTFAWIGRVRGAVSKVTLGEYGTHNLKNARDWARGLTRRRDLGEDIAGDTRGLKRAAIKAEIDASRTVAAVFETYWQAEGRLVRDHRNKRAKFDNQILPVIGHRVMADLEFEDLSDIIATKAKVHPIGANRLHSEIARLWRWAATTAIGRQASGLKVNVYAGVAKPSRERSRDRYLNDREIGWLWRSLETESIQWQAFYRLLLLTACRKSEISESERGEFDIENALFTLEGARTKTGVAHLVPLSPAALAVLETVLPQATGKYVFATVSTDDTERSVRGFSRVHARVMKVMLRLAQVEDPHFVVEPFTIHDLRRTVSTGLASQRVISEVIEAVLNHSSGKVSGQARTYNRFKYLDEKREALERWAVYLARITKPPRKLARAA